MSNAKNIAFVFIVGSWMLLQSCSVSKQIHKQAQKILLQDTVINTGHIGISIYDPATNTYLYNYNADKYFVPASNVKLFTLYAGMKYLGDSLVGLRYKDSVEEGSEFVTIIQSTGDPTFLHSEFTNQPVLKFLKSKNKVSWYRTHLAPFGKGWAWDDYQEPYMRPNSEFPMYNNLIRFTWVNMDSVAVFPPFFTSITKKLWPFEAVYRYGFETFNFLGENEIGILPGDKKNQVIPFPTNFTNTRGLLNDTLKNLTFYDAPGPYKQTGLKVIHSQPTDSLLTPMMHNSDNFFGEQTLLMVSNEYLGHMNDDAIIDTLLKADLKDIPQQPKWVDGSGLSRYNLFTPQSFVYILDKMKNEFGLERLKTILPTGGEGTLKNYYNSDSGFIYAKTGSLSNQITLSGFLITKKNKLLAFSILANNVVGDGWKVRRAYEQFLKKIREQY